jgi:hypothetical protein
MLKVVCIFAFLISVDGRQPDKMRTNTTGSFRKALATFMLTTHPLPLRAPVVRPGHLGGRHHYSHPQGSRINSISTLTDVDQHSSIFPRGTDAVAVNLGLGAGVAAWVSSEEEKLKKEGYENMKHQLKEEAAERKRTKADRVGKNMKAKANPLATFMLATHPVPARAPIVRPGQGRHYYSHPRVAHGDQHSSIFPSGTGAVVGLGLGGGVASWAYGEEQKLRKKAYENMGNQLKEEAVERKRIESEDFYRSRTKANRPRRDSALANFMLNRQASESRERALGAVYNTLE